ncbi:MAG: M20 family metallopeptidase [Phycisphaerales bacterium]
MSTTPAVASLDRVRSLIHEELDALVAIRHDLHAHPEIGYEEHRTSGVIRRELEAAGVAFVGDLAGGTGVLAHVPGDGDQAIGLRADIDALPIEEATGLPYASTISGRMHACGHDGHTTVLLGAARVLSRLAKESPLPNPVTFCFQPAEEGGAGGERMVADGCLDGSVIGPPVAAMYGLHGWPQLPLGEAGSRPGPLLAAADMFSIRIDGDGGHAAAPHLAKDPIVCGSALVQMLQSLVSRNVDPTDSAVCSVTTFHAGTAHNIIPGAAAIGGTVRTITEETRELMKRRLHEAAAGVAAAHGCTASVDWHDGYPVTRNDPSAWRLAHEILGETLGSGAVHQLPSPTMGGEDFAYYGQKVPACFFFLGLRDPKQETMAQLHQDTFDFNDDAIPVAIELFCRLAMTESPSP